MAIDLVEERAYLEGLKEDLKKEADKLLHKMDYYSSNYQESARYIWEAQNEFDGYEMLFNLAVLNGIVDAGEQSREQLRRILKILDSPYFSRIDFLVQGDKEPMKVYIGKLPFWKLGSDRQVFDWRAPVSSMYYEFDDGPAYYDAPTGRVEGNIICKRQYQIRKGNLEYAIESNIKIDDEILRQELARNSDHRMKDIVATIQREQDRLIRNESAQVLIVQGAAGSGKTSIALHRVAYFLYRYKGEISAEDFLMISPNGIFVDYVSGVLPELGEESIKSLGMEHLAAKMMPKEIRWESLSSQAERFLQEEDQEWQMRWRFKTSVDFLESLQDYLGFCDETMFHAEDYYFEGGMVEESLIRKFYERRKSIPVRKRISEMASAIKEEIRAQNRSNAQGAHIREILDWLMSRMSCLDAMELYRRFYDHIGHSEMFVYEEGGILECADIFPFLYVKLYLEGWVPNEKVKYLIVDEMQDYTPVQYAILNQLYPSQKTLLGDFAQNIVPFTGSSLEYLKEQYPQAQVIEINRSYRSTYEIMSFAKQVGGIKNLEPVMRHGEDPKILACKGGKAVRGAALNAVKDCLEQKNGKLGIICKSFHQAESLFQHLTAKMKQEFQAEQEQQGQQSQQGQLRLEGIPERIHLLTSKSNEFYEGVMVMSVAMSKGLEFDHVLVMDVDDKNFHTEYERGLLYVACTRAMHSLTLVYTGTACRFIPKGESVSKSS